ncbi:CRE-GST-13 protein [Aphelenchoides fujianensis]|nr:CRE-GST-13 protein [Aphelenchoides fujianensis]
MPEYRLTYLIGRGLTEASRLVLHYAGQPFEDVQLDRWEFAEKKSSEFSSILRLVVSASGFPNGQLPLLEWTGEGGRHQLSQSGAIVRFLAREFGLDGRTNEEAARAEEIWSFFYDRDREAMPFYLIFLGKADGDLEEAREKIFVPVARRSLQHYERLIAASENGFLLPSGVTYADFAVVEHLTTIFFHLPALRSEHPALAEYVERVHGLEPIAEYVKNRPKDGC